MKQIITFFGAISFALLILTGCSGSKDKFKLPDPPVDLLYEGVQLIDGPLSDYVEVLPGTYLFEIEKEESEWSKRYKGKMNVKFKFNKPLEVKAGVGYNQYGPSLLGKVLDEQGVPIDLDLDIYASKELAAYLKRGSGEEWLTLLFFGFGSIESEDEAKKLLDKFNKGKKIRFNSEIIEEKFESASSSSSTSSSSDSSDDCDEFLKGYEKFMDDYIAIIKKYKKDPTNMSIMTDYVNLLSESSDWESKSESCMDDPKIASKIAEIQIKIIESMEGL